MSGYSKKSELPHEIGGFRNNLKLSLWNMIPWAWASSLPSIFSWITQKTLLPSTSDQSITAAAAKDFFFRPYVSRVPWHTGPRAFLSHIFPRYGHYCGPNWSSGKNRGSPIWDRRPIDWLDFCCYCHDIGYDTHDQADLLKADMAFLECLEASSMQTKGNQYVASLYKTVCIKGLKHLLIPYRMQFLKVRAWSWLLEFGLKWRSWSHAS